MVNIRKAKKDDFDKILKLAKELYEAELPFDKNLNKDYYNNQKVKDDLRKSISSRKKTFLVAEKDRNLVGYVDGYLMDKEVYISKVAYLDHLCVSEKYRKQGIGKMLMDEFTKIMKEKDAKFIKLNAFENNIAAISFYKKEEFKEYSIYYMKEIK